MLWILDLDGVIWRGEEPIAGAAEAVARIRQGGHGLVFMTNNSSLRVDDCIDKLGRLGIGATGDELATSAQAAATLLEPGSRGLVCAGPGVEEALRARGVEPVRDPPADAVVVGWHRDFDYDRLTAAFVAVSEGARLIGTNDDATYPTENGAVPGGGAILAAVAKASSTDPEVAGKPHAPMASLVASRLKDATGESVLVGDRASTDGLMAKRLGVPFALVLSGVTGRDDLPVDPEPVMVADNLDALVGPDGELVGDLDPGRGDDGQRGV